MIPFVRFLPLRGKIYLLLLMAIIFFAGIVAVAYINIRNINTQVRQLRQENTHALVYIQLARDVAELKRQVQLFTYSGNASAAEAANRLHASISAMLDKEAASGAETAAKDIEPIAKHLDKYYQTFQSVRTQRELYSALNTELRDTAEAVENGLQNYIATTDARDKRALAFEIFTTVLQAEKGIFRYFETLEQRFVNQAKHNTQDAQEKFEKLITMEGDAAVRQKIENLALSHNAFSSKMLKAVQHNRGQLFLVNVVMAAEAYETIYQANTIRQRAIDEIKSIEQKISDSVAHAQTVIMGGSSVFFILMLLTALQIIRHIVTPISALTDTFLALSKGDSATPIPEYVHNDELGELTKAASVFKQKNEETVRLLENSRHLSNQLALSEQRLRVASESGQIGIWEYDLQKGTLSWDPTMFTLYGLREADNLDNRYDTWRSAVHPDDLEKTEAQLQDSITANKTFDTAFRILHPDGSVHYIKAFAYPRYTDNGEPLSIIGVNYDITESEQLKHHLEERVREEVEKQRRQEQVLIQQSKLAAMGEMISAISHQWRQPLNAVGLYLQDLVSAYRNNELDAAYLEESVSKSLEQVRYMSSTIEDFRNFFKPDSQESDLDVAAVIGDAIRLFEAQLKNNFIHYNFEYDADDPIIVHGNANHLRQVLMNLVSNAVDAIKEAAENSGSDYKGEITVRLQREGDKASITIDDNGAGISEEHLDRVFEPYYTTKEEGKGSGIGLYMSRTIVQQYFRGDISITPKANGVQTRITLSGQKAAATEHSS